MAPASQVPKLMFASVLLLGMSVYLTDAIRCYVCGPIEQGFNQTCEHFLLNVTRYEQQCGDKFFGCSTHFEGVDSTRQCQRMRINDCKKANNIEYCYCSANLCNGITSVHDEGEQNTDDEDILDEQGEDGSGNDAPSANNEHKNDINVIVEDVGGIGNIGGNSIDQETKETKTSSATNVRNVNIKVLSLFLAVLHLRI